MGKRGVKGRKNSIQNLFSPYSNRIIRAYVENVDQNKRCLCEMQEHNWMREEVLCSDLYACQLNGERVVLKEFLFGDASANVRQNIIVIQGEKHIGKKFFIYKLLDACKESVNQESRNLMRTTRTGKYRIPVIITPELLERINYKMGLESLIVEAIEEGRPKAISRREKENLRKDVKKLLMEGRFFLYFYGKKWLKENESRLRKILYNGNIVQDYKDGAKYRNLAILTVDSEEAIKESFLNEYNHVSIRLEKLTEIEVKSYLRKYLPKLLTIAEDDQNIIEMLRYPEHLKMCEALYDKDLIVYNEQLDNAFDFYEYFLRMNIRSRLKELAGTDVLEKIKEEEEEVLRKLKDYTVGFYLEDQTIIPKPSEHFRFEDYQESNILNEKGRFKFPLCGYYLLAKYLVGEIKQKKIEEIPECLMEKPLEMVLLWVSRMLDTIEDFTYFWNLLSASSSCKLLLRAKVVKETKFFGAFQNEVYEEAFSSLKNDFYDYTVLETFEELNGSGVDYLKMKYLTMEGFEEKEKNNIKKRIVYFLGISHNGIVEQMLDELMTEVTDQHLKYHIIRAAVENYGIHKDTTELIENRLDELEDYCGTSSDPIIKSDFCVLYQKCRKEAWTAPSEFYQLTQELKKRMEDETYWVRAHAAGAFGRRNILKAYDLLLERVRKELQLIYNQEKGYRNSIKVISYSIEAICELNDRRNGDRRQKVICQLVDVLDMDKLGDRDIEDAYSTIATGIEYLINADTEKLPFNLGGRFRNHIINYQKVLRNTFQELEYTLNADSQTMNEIRKKKSKLEKIMKEGEWKLKKEKKRNMDKIRILHVTDWHYQGDNSDNNMLLWAAKNHIKNIDLLVITGDLRQFGEDYAPTLKLLKDLMQSLELEPQDVFLVPGNHDCDNYEEKEKIFQEIRMNMYQDKECYRAYLEGLYQGFCSYERFLREFYGETFLAQGGLHNKIISWRECLNILVMNTALLCDESSEKNKLVDIAELTSLERTNDYPVLCIAHHKLSQLYLDHEDMIKRVFENLKVSALLSGDIHRSIREEIYLNPYTIPNYVCGKFLGDTSDTWSTRNLAIYEVNLKDKKLTPDLYKLERGSLVPDVTFRQKPKELEGEWKKMSVNLL